MSANVREGLVKNAPQILFNKLQPLLLQAVCAGVAFLAACAPVFGTMRPLALGLAAAVPGGYALAACAGAAVGSAVMLSMDAAAPYLASVIAVALLRALSSMQTRKRGAGIAAFAGAACFLLVQTVMLAMRQGSFNEVLGACAEAMLIFGVGVVLRTAFTTPWRTAAQSSPEARAALLCLLMAAVICLAPYTVLGLHPARILCAGAALFAALCGREQLGAVVGIACAAGLAAANDTWLYAGFAVALAAMTAGFFLQDNRVITALVFCGAGFLGVPFAPAPLDGLYLMGELCLGAGAVFLLPARVFAKAPVINPASVGRATLTTLSGRLDLIAGALSTVGTTLDAVCERLPKKGENYADVCDAVTAAVCQNCARCAACWTEGSEAFDALNNMKATLDRKGYVTPDDIPEPLHKTCALPRRMTTALSTAYRASLSRRNAYLRSKVTRAAITEQYSAMASALAYLAGRVYREEMPDHRRARRLDKLLRNAGMEPMETLVSADSCGCLHADVELPRTVFSEEELLLLTREASAVCRCKFSPADCRHAYASTHLHFAERPLFTPEFGVCILPAKGDISGDVCKTFTDLQGCAHAVLCDGMGTGRAAAIDGNLAASLSERLMTAGFAASEAARLVNVALSLKGEGDAGATLDALTVNLYSGKASLFKAGAAASFLVRESVVTLLEGDTLPIGTLGSVSGCASALHLQRGDLLVMASDGAVQDGTAWLCAALTGTGGVPAQTLATRLAEEAKSRATRPDDISVLCLRLAETA